MVRGRRWDSEVGMWEEAKKSLRGGRGSMGWQDGGGWSGHKIKLEVLAQTVDHLPRVYMQ